MYCGFEQARTATQFIYCWAAAPNLFTAEQRHPIHLLLSSGTQSIYCWAAAPNPFTAEQRHPIHLLLSSGTQSICCWAAAPNPFTAEQWHQNSFTAEQWHQNPFTAEQWHQNSFTAEQRHRAFLLTVKCFIEALSALRQKLFKSGIVYSKSTTLFLFAEICSSGYNRERRGLGSRTLSCF